MTEFRNITRVQVDFVNRDGVPTAFIMDGSEVGDTRLDVGVHEDGLHADIDISNISLSNNGKEWRFTSLEDPEGIPGVATLAAQPAKSELGPVARWSIGVVALAILAPFVAILWAWAGQVFRSFS